MEFPPPLRYRIHKTSPRETTVIVNVILGLPCILRRPLPAALLAVCLLSAWSPKAESNTVDLFDGFRDGWRDAWKEQRLFPFQKPTVYSVETSEGGIPVLRGDSSNANLGLVRPLSGEVPARAVLRWRWKVDAPLAGNNQERERRGDDFAARVFVVFERSMIPTHTRAINYVWAAHEPAGSIFPNAYTRHVGMIVLRSGSVDAGNWVLEERNLLDDYRRFFGEEPTELNAVALMVDTDDTGLSATARFGDLELEIPPAPPPQ